MPMELQIIRAHEFIRLGPQGRFDLKAQQGGAGGNWARRVAAKRGQSTRRLLDLRALHPGPKAGLSRRTTL